MIKKIEVVAAAILSQSGQQLFIAKRPDKAHQGGLWEFPGGKIRDGESNLDAARRELGEELNAEVVGVGRRLFTAMDPGSPYSIEFVEVEINKGRIRGRIDRTHFKSDRPIQYF